MANNRAWFSYVNHIRTAELSADSEEETLPVANIADRLSFRKFRSTSETVTISAAWDEAVTFQCVVLMFPAHRDPVAVSENEIDPTDEITVNVSNVAPGGSEILSNTAASGVVRQRGYYALVFDDPVTARYLDITIDATSRAALLFVDVSYLHVGPLFYPSANFNVGSTIGFPEESLINVSPTGASAFVESRGRLLSFDGVWGLVTEDERQDWLTMQESVGLTHPLAFGLTDQGSLARKVFIARFTDEIRQQFGQAGFSSARVTLLENR